MQAIQFKLNNRIISVGNFNTNPINLIYKLGRALFILMIALLPLAFLSSTIVYSEDIAFALYSSAVLLGIGCFLALVLYKGKNVLIDPANFVNVLIFALLVITPTVISTPSSSANTFGVIGLRSISGLATILFVIAFYLINLFNLKDRIWGLFPKIASIINIVILFMVVAGAVHPTVVAGNSASSTLPVPVLGLLTIVSVINFLVSLRLSDDRLKILNTVVLGISLFLTYGFLETELKIALPLLLGVISYFFVLRIVKGIGVKNVKTELVTNRKFQSYSVVLAVSTVALLMTILTVGIGSFPSITRIFNYFTNFGTLNPTSVGQILFGKGLLNSAASGNSTLYITISSFGLLALAGFLYLFFYVLLKEIKAKRTYNVIILSLIALGSIFTNLGVYINIVFLFILIQSSAFSTFKLNPSINTSNKYIRYARRIGVVAILIGSLVIVINLLKFLKILV